MLNLFKKRDSKLNELNNEKQDYNDKDNDKDNINDLNRSKISKKRFNNFFNNDNIIKPQRLDRKTRTRIQMTKENLKPKKINELEEEFEDTIEQKAQEMQDYVDLNLTMAEFFNINFCSRNIVVNALFNISIFHPRWKKLTLLFTEITLISLFISIFLTAYEKVTISKVGLILVFSLISSFATDITLYLLAYFFYFPPVKLRRLLHLVKENGNLIILKEWNEMSYAQGYKAFFGYIICIIIWGITYYVTFGFTVVWKYQNSAFYLCLILCFAFEFLIFELITELINAFCFEKRRNHNCLRIFGEFLNRMRNYRCMSP